MTSLLWFRRDLRLADHHALDTAAADGPVVALYVFDEDSPSHGQAIGAAQRWWLHHSLAALSDRLGGRLLLRRGPAAKIVAEVADSVSASAIHANRLFEPWEQASERALGERLVLHDDETLVPSEGVRTGAGQPFKIYGAFWRALSEQLPPAEPIDPPAVRWAEPPRGDRLEDWALRPTRPDWATGFGEAWTPGEEGARERLADFAERVDDYAERRDRPSIDGTSDLSPHLHFGEVSARQVWHALAGRGGGGKFLKELAWRDFSRQAVRGQPDLGWQAGRPAMRGFPYRSGARAEADFLAWTRGLTGYPIVDAGMRQMWAIGWMHNRVRMIAASFLVKHLLVDWRRGAAWFWDCLVDADYGNNSLNWQWIAGTGSDSQLFSRIMAPLSQSEKFGAGDYIRRWVPELAHLGDEAIHDPPDDARGDYPAKIIGHREGRERALAALARMRG